MFKLIAISLIIIPFKNISYWSLFDPGSQYHPLTETLLRQLTLVDFQWNSCNGQFLSQGCNGICFSGQETGTTDYSDSSVFYSKCQCLLKSKGEHYKLEPSLPTKTIQEAAPLFPSQLWEMTPLSGTKDNSRWAQPFSSLSVSSCWGFHGCISKLLETGSPCSWSMEWALDFRSL